MLFSMQHVGSSDFRKLSWLTVSDRVRYFKLVHVFKIKHCSATQYLMPNFKLIMSSHSHSTRGSSHNYFISKDISNAPSSFSFTAIRDWNSLPSELKEARSELVFRTKLKEYLMVNY